MDHKDADRFGQIGNQMFDHLCESEGLTPGESLVVCGFLIGIIMANTNGITTMRDANERLTHIAGIVLSVYERTIATDLDHEATDTKH